MAILTAGGKWLAFAGQVLADDGAPPVLPDVLDAFDGSVFDGNVFRASTPPFVPDRGEKWLVTLEGDDAVEALAPAGLNPLVVGADIRLMQTAGVAFPVNGADRDYGFANTMWGSPNAAQWMATTERFNRRAVRNLWWGGATTAERYNIAAFELMASGAFNDRYRKLVQSLPIGDSGAGIHRPADGSRWYQFRFPVMHEPDIYTDMNLPEHAIDPDGVKEAFCLGMEQVLSAMVEAAMEKNADPFELGFGGCLAASDTDAAYDWRWWEWLKPTTKASPFVQPFWDEYFEFNNNGTAPSFLSRINTRIADFGSGWGLMRPFVAETSLRWHAGSDPTYTVIGTNTEALKWEAEMMTALTTGLLEGVASFHSGGTPSATGSYFTTGRGPWLTQHTQNHLALLPANVTT